MSNISKTATDTMIRWIEASTIHGLLIGIMTFDLWPWIILNTVVINLCHKLQFRPNLESGWFWERMFYREEFWLETLVVARRWRASGRKEERKAKRVCSCRKQQFVLIWRWKSSRGKAQSSTSSSSNSSQPGVRATPTRCLRRNRWCPPKTSINHSLALR